MNIVVLLAMIEMIMWSAAIDEDISCVFRDCMCGGGGGDMLPDDQSGVASSGQIDVNCMLAADGGVEFPERVDPNKYENIGELSVRLISLRPLYQSNKHKILSL